MVTSATPLKSDRSFSSSEIQGALSSLGIKFAEHGKIALTGLKFSSLFSVRASGIYYLEGSPELGAAVDGSLFIAAAPVENDTVQTLVVERPQVAFYKLMQYFFSEPLQPSIHPTACVSESAIVHPTAYIGPYCVLDNCVIGPNASLASHVVVMDGTTIGANVVIESHSTIGATGVAWVWCQESQERVIQPQIGGTDIQDSVFIGTDVTIVRGSINEVTTIGSGTVIAHGSKIGHGCQIGPECHFANNISLAGNVRLGRKVFLGAAAVVRPKTIIADDVVVGAGAVVVKNQLASGFVLQGVPAIAIPLKRNLSGVPVGSS